MEAMEATLWFWAAWWAIVGLVFGVRGLMRRRAAARAQAEANREALLCRHGLAKFRKCRACAEEFAKEEVQIRQAEPGEHSVGPSNPWDSLTATEILRREREWWEDYRRRQAEESKPTESPITAANRRKDWYQRLLAEVRAAKSKIHQAECKRCGYVEPVRGNPLVATCSACGWGPAARGWPYVRSR